MATATVSESSVRLRASSPEPFVEQAIDVSFSIAKPGILARSLGIADIESTVTRSADKFHKATTMLAGALNGATQTAKDSTDGLRADLASVLPTLTDFADRITTAAADANVNAKNINNTLLSGIDSINSMFSRLIEPTGPIAQLLRFFVSTGMLLVQLFGDSSSTVKIASISAYLVNLPFVSSGILALLKGGFEFIMEQVCPEDLIDPYDFTPPEEMMMHDMGDTEPGVGLFRGIVGVLSSILGFRADNKETIERARSINTNLGVIRSLHAVIKMLIDLFKGAFTFVAEMFSADKQKLRALYEEIELWKEMTMLFDIGGALYMVASDCSYANVIIAHEAYGRELETKCKLFNHEDSVHRQTLQEMKIRLDVLKPIKDAAVKARHLNQDRPEPVIMYIYGEPGIGKSSVVDSIAAYFYTLMSGKAFKKSVDMFTFNAKDAYFSGYSNQAVVFIDDMFQMKNKEATQKAVEFIFKAKGDHQQPLEMAEIEKKGTTVLTSQLIICTANVELPPHAFAEVVCGDALRRRFDFIIKMEIKPEYLLAGSKFSVDPLKVLPKFGHATFEVTEVNCAMVKTTLIPMLKSVVVRYAKLQAAVANKRIAADEMSAEMLLERDGPAENWVDASEVQWPDNSIIRTVRPAPASLYIGGGCVLYHDKKCYTLEDLPEGSEFGSHHLCSLVEIKMADVTSLPHQVEGPFKITRPVKVGTPFMCTHARHSAAFIPMFVGGTSYESKMPVAQDYSLYAGIRHVFLRLKALSLKGVEITKEVISTIVDELIPYLAGKITKYFGLSLLAGMTAASGIWKFVSKYCGSICSLETALKVLAIVIGGLASLATVLLPGYLFYKKFNASQDAFTSKTAGPSGDPQSKNRIVPRPGRSNVFAAAMSGDPQSVNRIVARPGRSQVMGECRQDAIIKKDGKYQSLAATGIFCQQKHHEDDMMFQKGDVNAHSMALSALRKNMVAINVTFYIGETINSMQMNAVGVCGRLILTNNHLIPRAAERVEIRLQKFGGEMHEFESKDFHVIRPSEDGRDYMAIYFPRMVTQFTDIRRQFLTFDDHKRIHWNGSAMLVGVRQSDCSVLPAVSYVKGLRKVISRMTTQYDGKVEESKALIQFDTEMWNGSCGSLLTINQSDLTAKFVGIMATGNAVSSCASVVYREDIEEFMEEAEKYHLPTRSLEKRDCPVVDPTFIPIEDGEDLNMTTMGNNQEGFVICGKLDPLIVARAATKSSIVESVLHGAREPTTRRARLTIHTVTNEDGTVTRKFPQDGSISKQKAPQWAPHWDSDDIEYVEQCVLAGYTSRRSPHDKDYAPLSDAENINGRPGCKDFTSIVTSTSAGLPMNAVTHIDGEPRAPGKKSFFKGQPGSQYMSPTLDSLVSQLEEVCETHVPCVIATIVNKDERRPPHKADSPRTISTLAVEVSYLIRRYFVRFIAHVNYHHNSGEVKIGINAFSAEWEQLHAQMTRNSNRGQNTFGFDYSSYDKQLPKELTDATIDMINEWYYVCYQRKVDDDMSEFFEQNPDASDEQYFEAKVALEARLEPEFIRHQQIRRNLWYAISECYYANGDIVYRTSFGNPSGNPMTTHMNSIVNQMLVRLAYLGVVDSYKFPFEENVELAVFGDDAIVAVSDLVKDRFNFFTCKADMAFSGIKITWPSKVEADEREFSHIAELSFLKRGFKMCQEYGRIVGPMDKDVIFETPLWIRTGMDPTEATVENYKTNLREAALHGKEFFNEYKKTFSDYANVAGISIPVPTYNMVLKDHFAGW